MELYQPMFRGSDPNNTDEWGIWLLDSPICPWNDVAEEYLWEYAE